MSIIINPLQDGRVKFTNGDTGKDLLSFDAEGNVTFYRKLNYDPDYTSFSLDLVGSIQVFIMGTKPKGRYIKANGALLNRSAYSDLFEAIGTQWGVGDGSTTFGTPDLRGEFLRFWDDGRGVDSGRVFGSDQSDTVQISEDSFSVAVNGSQGIFHRKTTGGPFRTSDNTSTAVGQGVNSPTARRLNFNNSWSQRTSNETRPRNVALQAWIRY